MARSKDVFNILVVGIMLTTFGLAIGWPVWLSQKDLVQVSGKLTSVQLTIRTVQSRKGAKSQLAQLSFSVEGNPTFFVLKKNIGNDWWDPEYERVKKNLEKSQVIFISISKNDLENPMPEVFEIANEKGVLVKFDSLVTEHRAVASLLLAAGLGFLMLWFYQKYPSLVDKLMSKLV